MLVVEDDRRLRELLIASINDMGLLPTPAGSAEAALRLVEQDEPYAVAVVDLNLPGMNRLDLCERLRRTKPFAVPIILTGFGDLKVARRAIRLEVVDFLTKPCGMDDLERALSQARLRWLDRWFSELPQAFGPCATVVGNTDHRVKAPAMNGQPLSTEELRALDRQHIWHPFTPHSVWNVDDPLVIVEARGMHLIDSDGRRYLDGVSSLWCNVHGHRVPEIDAAIREQLGRVAHSTMLGLTHEPGIRLADALMKIVPPNLSKVFFSDSGATATEVAFKLAAQFWHNQGRGEKCEFVGFTEAYHGDTFGAMSVGRTEAFHRPYFPMLFKTHFAPTPFVYRSDTPGDPVVERDRCLAELATILQQHAHRIAAVCIEPIVQGAAGMIVHPPGFLAGVRQLCDNHDVLLIADEVAVGFGRTGRMFACEHEGVPPDLMCVAKGITGGYLPLAATFATQRIYDTFLGDPSERRTFFHGHTYTGNPLACAAALASLQLFERNRLLEAVRVRAEQLAGWLAPLRELSIVGDIRQKGLMVGVELVADNATRRSFDPKRRVGAAVCKAVREHGVILRPLGDVIVIMPPLAMQADDLKRIVTALAEVLTAAA